MWPSSNGGNTRICSREMEPARGAVRSEKLCTQSSRTVKIREEVDVFDS